MLFPKTKDFLSSHSLLWNDGYLAFGFGKVAPPGRSIAAALEFFSSQHVVTTMNGSLQELLVTERALRRVEAYRGPHMLVSLLEEELRMFSSYSFEKKHLDTVAALFFEEMGDCEVYTNMSTTSADLNGCGTSLWSPVTKRSQDFFLCAINDRHLGYWLHTNDE